MFSSYLVVGLGGALGTVARFWAGGVIARRLGEAFPWDTLLINVSGSLAIGGFAALAGPEGPWSATPSLRQFFMIGLCGGYTTFSAFSLQTLELMRSGAWFRAGANAVASVVLCLVAVWLGHLLGTSVASARGR